MKKTRLDVALVERKLVESRSLAQRLVMAGKVRVDGQVVLKSSTKISSEACIDVSSGPPYVSRAGEKLEAALHTFNIDVDGMKCADVGASTGGFTDCLLQNGAAMVFAIDVGHGILHWKLRNDPRVIVMERTNARYLKQLPTLVDVVTIDVSFISLKKILPAVKGWFPSHGKKGISIALIKPQFEAGKEQVKRGKGVIKDPEIHRHVLHDILAFSSDEGYGIKGLMRSPILGPKGNIEFLVYLEYPADISPQIDRLIVEVMGDPSIRNAGDPNLPTANKWK